MGFSLQGDQDHPGREGCLLRYEPLSVLQDFIGVRWILVALQRDQLLLHLKRELRIIVLKFDDATLSFGRAKKSWFSNFKLEKEKEEVSTLLHFNRITFSLSPPLLLSLNKLVTLSLTPYSHLHPIIFSPDISHSSSSTALVFVGSSCLQREIHCRAQSNFTTSLHCK